MAPRAETTVSSGNFSSRRSSAGIAGAAGAPMPCSALSVAYRRGSEAADSSSSILGTPDRCERRAPGWKEPGGDEYQTGRVILQRWSERKKQAGLFSHEITEYWLPW